MKRVELYARVRHAVQLQGISRRAEAERFGIDPRTVSKMLKFSVPPGYVRTKQSCFLGRAGLPSDLLERLIKQKTAATFGDGRFKLTHSDRSSDNVDLGRQI